MPVAEKLNILIAEDENIIALDIAESIRHMGYNVCGIVHTASDAINKAGELKPDLILMDIMLEDNSSGIEAAEKILQLCDIPIIYLTALADSETIKKAKITEPFGYLLKPYEPKSLHSTIEMAIHKHNVNQKLKERTRELEEERLKSERLLQNILPKEIIKELREHGSIKPRKYKSITILYTDFQSFTSIASQLAPQALLTELNDIFNKFDAIIENYNLEKMRTVGDSYFAAGGVPIVSHDHAEKIVLSAMEMQDFLKKRITTSGIEWRMRVGIHSGSAIAGVVGKKKFTYDVWGATVITAGMLEKICNPGEIIVSESTYRLISERFECYPGNPVKVFDNEVLKTYYVKGKKN